MPVPLSLHEGRADSTEGGREVLTQSLPANEQDLLHSGLSCGWKYRISQSQLTN